MEKHLKYFLFILLSMVSVELFAIVDDNTAFTYIQPISVESNTFQSLEVNPVDSKLLIDDDKDSISNRDDKCPKTKTNTNVDSTGCNPDDDKDGVINTQDECPNTSSDFMVDSTGCPQTAVLRVEFESAKHTILPQSLIKVQEFAAFLEDNMSYQVIIYGYTDNLGDSEKNKELSRNRAKSVMNALIDSGIKLTRLTAIGMGSKNPIADNATSQGRAENRRIEVELLQ